jgi:predicted ArsR family transcriptional regulator
MAPVGRRRLMTSAERHRLLGDPTRLAVLDALRTGERTIPELVEVTAMHRNTVRNHVHRLEEGGLVDSRPGPPGSRGRPALRYRLREPDTITDGPVFVEGLVSLLRRTQGPRAPQLAEAEGERVGRGLRGGAAVPATPAQAVRQVAQALERLAFEPTVHRHGGAYSVDLHHCPFWGRPIERDGDIICAFHRGLIRGIVQSPSATPVAVRLMPLVERDLCRTEVEFEAG